MTSVPSQPPPAQADCTIGSCVQFLGELAPLRLAEDWDNTGLLAGDRARPLRRIMTCLTITPESAAEAISGKADLIVTHHPLPFRAIKQITTETIANGLLWDLIRAGIAIYSPHTAFDSAAAGINQSLADRFGLADTKPLLPIVGDPDGLGAGRFGETASSIQLADFVALIKSQLQLPRVSLVGDGKKLVRRVGVACGSGGSFLDAARRQGCDTLVTGEATFHACLESKASNISLVLLGHYASERFAVEMLAERLRDWLKNQQPAASDDSTASDINANHVWASNDECDPLSQL